MSATADQIHSAVLGAVKTQFEFQGVPGVRGYGPVVDDTSPNKKECPVLLENISVPFPAQVILPNPDGGPNIRIKIVAQLAPAGYRSLFSGRGLTRRAAIGSGLAALASFYALRPAAAADLTLAPPDAFPGPLMGGDAVFNDSNFDPNEIYWGTVGLIASSVTFQLSDGTLVNGTNVCISCDHVLRGSGSVISTVNFPQGMRFKWAHPDLGVGGKWVDIAMADSTATATPRELRGLGKINAVAEPKLGDILLKYGSTTGLTAGMDTGLLYRPFPDINSPNLFMVRSVGTKTGRFSFFGDSGSAVVEQRTRNLVGFVVGGTPEGENYYIPALPLNGTPVDPNLSTVKMQLN
ncbi:MAG: hypothetical protein U1E67_15665 [Hyphomicrobiales bacterium]